MPGKKKWRLVYLGSPEQAVIPLQYILEHLHDVVSLVAVVSQPAKPVGRGRQQSLRHPPVAQFAIDRNIRLFQPQKARDLSFLAEFAKLEPDIALTCAYGQILSQDFLNIPKRATINIHPSDLPKYRGATPVASTLLHGDTKTAVSILFTVKELDAGDMIVKQETEVKPDELHNDLLARLFHLSGPLLKKALAKLEDGDYKGEPQNLKLISECSKIAKSDGRVNFTQTAKQIYDRYRAFHAWPGVYCHFKEKNLILEEMSLYQSTVQRDGNNELKPGQLYFDKREKILLLKSQQGCLVIHKMKVVGKSSISAADFWNQIPKNQRDNTFLS